MLDELRNHWARQVFFFIRDLFSKFPEILIGFHFSSPFPQVWISRTNSYSYISEGGREQDTLLSVLITCILKCQQFAVFEYTFALHSKFLN